MVTACGMRYGAVQHKMGAFYIVLHRFIIEGDMRGKMRAAAFADSSSLTRLAGNCACSVQAVLLPELGLAAAAFWLPP